MKILLECICPHWIKSKWLRDYWALGHGTGYEVQICNLCGKWLESRCIKLEAKEQLGGKK